MRHVIDFVIFALRCWAFMDDVLLRADRCWSAFARSLEACWAYVVSWSDRFAAALSFRESEQRYFAAERARYRSFEEMRLQREARPWGLPRLAT
jgi:hypothetical protein